MDKAMDTTRFITFIISIFVAAASISSAQADRGVFNGKAESRHELTDWEKKKISAEFESRFSATKSGAFQKLNNNPWAAKKAREQQHQSKMLEMSATWGSCREYAYKQRGQCYARGGDAYTCERYYDARVKRCDDQF